MERVGKDPCGSLPLPSVSAQTPAPVQPCVPAPVFTCRRERVSTPPCAAEELQGCAPPRRPSPRSPLRRQWSAAVGASPRLPPPCPCRVAAAGGSALARVAGRRRHRSLVRGSGEGGKCLLAVVLQIASLRRGNKSHPFVLALLKIFYKVPTFPAQLNGFHCGKLLGLRGTVEENIIYNDSQTHKNTLPGLSILHPHNKHLVTHSRVYGRI